MHAIAIACLLLTGCASMLGVTISDAERTACEAQGCTVWTEQELQQLVIRSIQRGMAMARAKSI